MTGTPPNWPLPSTPLSPRPSSSRSAHSRNASAEAEANNKRLSAIEENSTAYYPSGVPIASSPPSATRGTFPRSHWHPGPRRSVDSLPPKYTLWDVTGPRGEKLRDLRNNKQIARRGGWKRLLAVVLLLVAVAVGLGVGLGVGLVKNQEADSGPAQPTSTAAAGNGSFPQGSYTFAGALASVGTACTSNPATFLCWPYMTYNASTSASAVAFDWVVAAQPSGDLALSSSNNPFAITFSNASLTQHDAGTPQERYSFSLSLDKYVVPTGPIDGSSTLAACWFNTTTLAGNLWTRRPADGGAVANGTANSTAQMLADWPVWQFAFDVNQTIAGGQDVPECYQQAAAGGEGARITTGLTAQPDSDECGCYWRNYAL
jgi:hypothetical protein